MAYSGDNIFRENHSAGVAKSLFAFLSGIGLIIVFFIMHFVIMYKGWGLSVQSWGWMIFFYLSSVLVNVIGGIAKQFIKKI